VGLSRPVAGARFERTYVLVCQGVKRNVKDMMEDSVLMCLIIRPIEAGCF